MSKALSLNELILCYPNYEEGSSIYSLSHEGVSGKERYMGLWPVAARRQAPDVRAGGRMSGASRGAGCPGLGPDVRAEVAKLRVHSVADAGFPGEGPDVRALARRRMSGR